MLTKEDLQLLSDLMDEKLKPISERLDTIDKRLDRLEEDVDILKEDTAAAKYASSELIRRVETNFSHKYPFPVDRNIRFL